MTSERCATFLDELAPYRAQDLEPERERTHAEHLAACPTCAAALAADAELDGLLSEADHEPTARAVAGLAAAAARLTATPQPATTQTPWVWIAAVGFALLVALAGDWGRPAPARLRPRDPWRYHAPPELDRDTLPLETNDQPTPGELTWRVL